VEERVHGEVDYLLIDGLTDEASVLSLFAFVRSQMFTVVVKV
jgi:hypothetical protein